MRPVEVALGVEDPEALSVVNVLIEVAGAGESSPNSDGKGD
jgi:hypothetical protein